MHPIRSTLAALVVMALLAPPGFASAAEPKADPANEAASKPAHEEKVRRGSGLPVPRFASMRSDEVNVRSGPGTRYPVEWVFQRKNMPVEVVAEFDTWRRIRDWQGATGWVHQSMLTGRRGMVVAAKEAVLLRTPEAAATPVARLEMAVQGQVLGCSGDYCRVEVRDLRGWIERKSIWGTYPNETIE